MSQSEISKSDDQSAIEKSPLTKVIEIIALSGLFFRRIAGSFVWFVSESTAFIVGASALLVYASARLGLDIVGYFKNGKRLKVLRELRFVGIAGAALSGLLGLHWIYIAAGVALAIPSVAISAIKGTARGAQKAFHFIRDSVREMYSEDVARIETRKPNHS